MKEIRGTLQREIAERLNITRQAVNHMAHRDGWRIVAVIGKTHVYNTADVERTLAAREKSYKKR